MAIGTADVHKQKVNDLFIRDIDQAVVNWFQKEWPVDFENRKTPVIFVSQERWAIAQKQKGFRDENGVLILPLITVKRLDANELYDRYVPKVDGTRMYTKRRIATSSINNTDRLVYDKKLMNKPIYEIIMAQFPTFVKIKYTITLHTSFLNHSNQIQENIWKKFDAGRSYFKHNGYYIFAEVEGSSDRSNIDDFTDTQRLFKHEYSFSIQAPLIDKNDTKIYQTFNDPIITIKEP